MIDKKSVREAFAAYTRNYDPSDVKIALKIAHTYRVADIAEDIARSLDLSDEDVLLAWLLGMLHDVGRFEQVTQYGTFMDSMSVDHAEFGADLLFGKDGMIGRFSDDEGSYELIETAIRQHNKLDVAPEITGRLRVFCDILRDADKVDIFRVNYETPMEEIYNTTKEELFKSPISPVVMEEARNHTTVPREVRVTIADHLIGHMALAFGLVYPRSREIAKEQGYIYKLFDFPTENPQAQKCIDEMHGLVMDFLDGK